MHWQRHAPAHKAACDLHLLVEGLLPLSRLRIVRTPPLRQGRGPKPPLRHRNRRAANKVMPRDSLSDAPSGTESRRGPAKQGLPMTLRGDPMAGARTHVCTPFQSHIARLRVCCPPSETRSAFAKPRNPERASRIRARNRVDCYRSSPPHKAKSGPN